jgi:hypothetical protein
MFNTAQQQQQAALLDAAMASTGAREQQQRLDAELFAFVASGDEEAVLNVLTAGASVAATTGKLVGTAATDNRHWLYSSMLLYSGATTVLLAAIYCTGSVSMATVCVPRKAAASADLL